MTRTSTFRTFTLVARHEWKLLIADRSLLLVCALLAAMICYGFYNGLAQTRANDAMIEKVLARDSEAAGRTLDRLRRLTAGSEKPGPFDNLANPATLGNAAGPHAVLPSLPLAPYAVGQSDMMPSYYRIGMKAKVDFLYDSEIENPWTLLSGHFDLAFVITWVLPLLIFALSYNLLSQEREDGTQRILLSQPLNIGTLVLGKLAVRAAALLGMAVGLPIILALAFRPETRGLEQAGWLVLWGLLVLGYGLFWFALAFAVNTLRRSSATNALILIASWTGLVLIVPVLLNLVVGHWHPAPSRTALANATRAIQADNLKRYDDLFSGDFRYIAEPETLLVHDGKIEIPPRTLASFLAKRDMDRRVDTHLQRFDDALAAQQGAVDRMSLMSPAIILHDGMTALAGTDALRHADFRGKVSRFHDGWRRHFEPFVTGGIAMHEGHLGALPAWRWHENSSHDPMREAVWKSILLLGLALVLVVFGRFKLKSYAAV